MEENKILFAEERKRKIVEILNVEEKVLVPDLSELFKVSTATIRSDLNELEKEGLLKRTHGGAIRMVKKSFEPNYSQKEIKRLHLIRNRFLPWGGKHVKLSCFCAHGGGLLRWRERL